jgi:hypothetical protein
MNFLRHLLVHQECTAEGSSTRVASGIFSKYPYSVCDDIRVVTSQVHYFPDRLFLPSAPSSLTHRKPHTSADTSVMHPEFISTPHIVLKLLLVEAWRKIHPPLASASSVSKRRCKCTRQQLVWNQLNSTRIQNLHHKDSSLQGNEYDVTFRLGFRDQSMCYCIRASFPIYSNPYSVASLP